LTEKVFWDSNEKELCLEKFLLLVRFLPQLM
jgi:hypothetical protein